MSRSPWSRLSLAVGLLSLAITGAGLATSPSPVVAASHHVQIAGSAFGPTALTVQVGDTVMWANADDRPHTVTADGGAFDSGNIDEGGSFSFTFTEPGTYTYRCEYHPDMQATIVVQAPAPAQANPAPPAADGEGAPQTGGGANTAQPAAGGGSGGGAGGDQPDTALAAPWSLRATSLVLVGLGLLAFAIGVAPRRRGSTSVATGMPGGWRR